MQAGAPRATEMFPYGSASEKRLKATGVWYLCSTSTYCHLKLRGIKFQELVKNYKN